MTGVLGAVSAGAAEVTALPPPSGAGVERGVAVLRCTIPDTELFKTSRATVLDVGAGTRTDVLLTTAHGLPPDAQAGKHDCRVLARGREYAIEEVWHAGGNLEGPEHDWAVILAARIPGEVRRWRPARFAPESLTELVNDAIEVRLVLRYAGAAQSDCRFEPQGSVALALLAYSCVSYPGTSGSPLVVGIGLEPVLIAIHVGSQLHWNGMKLDMVSVARSLDAEIAAAIEAAAARAVQPTTKPRRRPR
jgi:hypothetical protein